MTLTRTRHPRWVSSTRMNFRRFPSGWVPNRASLLGLRSSSSSVSSALLEVVATVGGRPRELMPLSRRRGGTDGPPAMLIGGGKVG